jgi:hypothetical protein
VTTPANAATAPKTTQPKNAPPPAAPWPFPTGVYAPVVQDYDETVTQTTSAQLLPIWNLSPTGWLRGMWLNVKCTVTGQSTNSVTYSEDDPFTVLQKVTVYDLGGEQIQTYSGYELVCINKFGGFFECGDPRADIQFTATTGTGSTAGTFNFNLYIPLEVVSRDALGTLQNESRPGWRVEAYVDSQAATYNQVPSVMGSIRVRGYVESYTEPAAQAPGGRPFAQTPPLPGSIQYWKSENDGVASGQASYDLTNGVGFPLRTIIYKVIDASAGTRAAGDANWPDPVQLLLGNVNLLNILRDVWLTKIARDFGLTNTTADAALGREKGVYPVYFTKDFGLRPGAEVRLKYLDTQVNTLLRLQGSFGAASSVFALSNWLATPSKDRYRLIAGG